MKKASVKARITLWITLLMTLLAGLLLVFTLSISSRVASQTSTSQLTQVLRSNAQQVELTDGGLEFGEDFSFYQSGVSTLIYSQGEALLAGQIPVSFTAAEPFKSGEIRTISTGSARYLVLDLWVPTGWDSGLWARGLMEAPDNRQLIQSLLQVALVALPVFILLAAVGGWLIVKRSFRPLDSIIATAENVNEARDLSRRIGLPPGRDEFSRLATAFDQLFARLERSFEAEKQFTADASHELRTPVSIIKGACEYGQRYDENPEERQETLEMIHRQAVKMSNLISQLLSMTRLEQGTELAAPEPVDLGELVRSLCEEQGYDQKRLVLELPEGLTVQADPALFSRLVSNLVDNAFKYSGPEGRVWIFAVRQQGETLLSVRDEGIGIAPDQQEKIWQRFYQVDSSRSEEGGAGLGLSMVKQIAQAHGGYLTLDSTPGVGSAFTLHLPDLKGSRR